MQLEFYEWFTMAENIVQVKLDCKNTELVVDIRTTVFSLLGSFWLGLMLNVSMLVECVY